MRAPISLPLRVERAVVFPCVRCPGPRHVARRSGGGSLADPTKQRTRRERRQGNRKRNGRAFASPSVLRGVVKTPISKRLSATDISALASMKNVAKCDTWCELQNPANHRVFERKLRPRPSGRGHACLGVTPKDAPHPPRRGGGRGVWPPVPHGAVGRSSGCRRSMPGTAQGGRSRTLLRAVPRRVAGAAAQGPIDRSARRSDRDPRSGGTTR